MIKLLLLSLSLACVCVTVQAQQGTELRNGTSAYTNMLLSDADVSESITKHSPFIYTNISDRQYINAFIKITKDFDEEIMKSQGVLVGTKAGDIWTIKIPIHSVRNFIELSKRTAQLELDRPVNANLEQARIKTNVNQVHEGLSLSKAYTGKDVVVGILDVGFDYTHPTFYNEDGTIYRIKRIWEQKSSGTPPAGYSYGHEIVDSSQMIQEQSDNLEASHGSHVAGIAAGSGYGADDSRYRGVAYKSNLVLVGITPPQSQWTNTGMTDIVDGLNYIFEYADSKGKAAVANLSWGCSIGPHDGTSLFSQAVDNLTGPGKIFTVSAGNNGGKRLHVNKTLSATDSVLLTFINWSSGLPDNKTWVDIWGERGESFCVELRLYRGPFIGPVIKLNCDGNAALDTFIIGSDADTTFVKMSSTAADNNGKPHAFFDIYSKTIDRVGIAVNGKSGDVHLWTGYVLGTRGYYNHFSKFGISGALLGDDDYTSGEMACTKSAISVGAYASKIEFRGLNGATLSYANYVDENDIVPFSSKGPTTDGRTKPEITAPGLTLASAVNSFDARYNPGGSLFSNIVHQYVDASNGRDYYYGESSGTSMSAPMAAGIIALLLEADPNLTPEEIKDLFASTAIRDEFTTPNPDPNIWGAGKIDAFAMLQSLLATAVESHELEEIAIYPNPTHDAININAEGVKSIRISNVLGMECMNIVSSKKNIELTSLNPGLYLLEVYNMKGQLIAEQKIIKY